MHFVSSCSFSDTPNLPLPLTPSFFLSTLPTLVSLLLVFVTPPFFISSSSSHPLSLYLFLSLFVSFVPPSHTLPTPSVPLLVL